MLAIIIKNLELYLSNLDWLLKKSAIQFEFLVQKGKTYK